MAEHTRHILLEREEERRSDAPLCQSLRMDWFTRHIEDGDSQAHRLHLAAG